MILCQWLLTTKVFSAEMGGYGYEFSQTAAYGSILDKPREQKMTKLMNRVTVWYKSNLISFSPS